MNDEIDWTSTHRAQKEEAERVRDGAINPHYVMHETYRDGAFRVENRAMHDQENALSLFEIAQARARNRISSNEQETLVRTIDRKR